MIKVDVLSGDITRNAPVEAIITLVNSGGMWFGGVDSAIQRAAGGIYHGQLGKVLETSGLNDGQVVITKDLTNSCRESFIDVVFVVDDLIQPLQNLVLAGLRGAEKAGYHVVGMPLMRTGVMLGVVERTIDDAVVAMKKGIEEFIRTHPDSSMNIKIVVYSDIHALALLEEIFPTS